MTLKETLKGCAWVVGLIAGAAGVGCGTNLLLDYITTRPRIVVTYNSMYVDGKKDKVSFYYFKTKDNKTELSLNTPSVKESRVTFFDNNDDSLVDAIVSAEGTFVKREDFPAKFEKADKVYALWTEKLADLIEEAQRKWDSKNKDPLDDYKK